MFYNFNEWELPQGAVAGMEIGKPTISFLQELSGKFDRMYARFVWLKELSGHLNPGAPEEGAGRLYQCVGELSFDSNDRQGYKASIFLRISGRSSGARRRGNEERKLYLCSGDPFCLFNVHSKDYGQISSRSWWPTSGIEWKGAKLYSYWDSTTVGLTSSSRTSFPKAGASALIPAQLEMERAEVLINFPSCLSLPATIKRHVFSGVPPPPPPAQPESSWEGGAASANYSKSTPAPPDLFPETVSVPHSALREYTGDDLLGMFTGSQ